MSRTIERMERSSPPGVSSWMTSAAAESLRACSMAPATRRTVTGVITPSSSRVDTVAARAGAAAAISRATATTSRPARETAGSRGLMGDSMIARGPEGLAYALCWRG